MPKMNFICDLVNPPGAVLAVTGFWVRGWGWGGGGGGGCQSEEDKIN